MSENILRDKRSSLFPLDQPYLFMLSGAFFIFKINKKVIRLMRLWI
jgi:hypothetical protein